MKKTGLGRDPLQWIQSTTAEKKTIEKEAELKIAIERENKQKKEGTPKFKTFDIRLTSLLREDQLDFLEKFTRDIQKNRTSNYRKERITKNTLIRVFIDAFKEIEVDTTNIPDEEALLERIRQYVKVQ